MRAERGSIATLIAELAPLTLILLAMSGMLALIILVHQRHLDRSRSVAATPPEPSPVAVAKAESASPPPELQPPVPVDPEPEAAEPLKPQPQPKPASPRIVEDPTPQAVQAILSQVDGEKRLAGEARKWETVAAWAKREASRLAQAMIKVKEDQETRVRETEVHLTSRLQAIESQAETLEQERERLAIDRDQAKREWLETKDRPRRAVVPYQGPNGTVKIPIAIDCQDDKVTILPNGPSFSLEELSPYWGGASHPFAVAVGAAARKLKQEAKSPYVLFLVRPDGIRPYYEARARLQSLGMAFGYELVDQDWSVDVKTGQPEDSSSRGRSRASGDPIVWKLADLPASEVGAKASPEGQGGVGMFSESPLVGGGAPSEPQPLGGGSPSAFNPAGGGTLPKTSNPSGGGWVSNSSPGRASGAGGPSAGTGTVIRLNAPPPSGSAPSGSAPGSGAGSGGQVGAMGSGSAPAQHGGEGRSNGGPGGHGDDENGDAPWVRTVSIVATCGPRGLTIRSEGLRVPLAALKAGDQRWLTHLRKVIQASQYLEPNKMIRARLRILIESGGEETYAAVRGQTLFSDWEWPVDLEVAPPDRPNPLLRGGY